MDLINIALKFIVSLIDFLLPVIGLSEEFTTGLDNAIAVIISVINAAGYFLPLNTLILCLMTVLIIDNATIILRIGQWLIGLIRG